MSQNRSPLATEAPSEQDADFDILAIVADFRRYMRLFIAVFILVFAAIVIPILTQEPKYTSVAQVMLDPRDNKGAPVEGVLSGLPSDDAQVSTEVQVIRSTTLANRVAEDLQLYKIPAWAGEAATAEASPSDTTRQVVANRLLSDLDVRREGSTRLIGIAYTHTSPEESARIANAWAKAYLQQQVDAKLNATRDANTWLDSRLEDLRNQVQQADAAVQQYKIENNLLSAEGATLSEQEISNYNQLLATAKAAQAEAVARLGAARRQLSGGSQGDDVGEALGSPVIQNLRSQRAEVSQRVAEMQGRYGPLHPEFIKAQRQLSDLDQQISAEIRRVISNLSAQVDVQNERVRSISDSLARTKSVLEVNNRANVELNQLQTNAEAARTLYESYLNRFNQTSSDAGANLSDARLVTAATVPLSPSAPKKALTLVFGFVAALGVATGVFLVRRAFDSGLTTGRDIEDKLNQNYLATIPSLESTIEKRQRSKVQPLNYVWQNPLSAFAEGFRSLRTSLLYTRAGQPVRVVAIASALPGEGKTTTAICLAQVIALAGQSVVVVDCDLRRRSINTVLQNTPEAGLLEVLAGRLRLEEALVTDTHKIWYLPLASTSTTTRDVFGSAAMDRVLEALKSRFDVVILDTAPVLPVVDTRILAHKADAVVMLARWRKTPRKATQQAVALLENANGQVAGVALTLVNLREQTRYGYGDDSYYHNHYKSYYLAS